MLMRDEVLYEVLSDLREAYDALNWNHCMEILVGYGLGQNIEGLLRKYWERLTMVAQAGCYYGALYKGQQGVTQGGLLFPTIFNMVVDAVIQYWMVVVVVGKELGTEGFGKSVQMLDTLFYADGGLLTSPRPAWIQEEMDVLIGLFDWALL